MVDSSCSSLVEDVPRRSPEFRRKVLDLLKAGRSVAELSRDLQISDQTIYNWRRQHLIDTGQLLGITSTDHAELVAACRRMASRAMSSVGCSASSVVMTVAHTVSTGASGMAPIRRVRPVSMSSPRRSMSPSV